MAEKLCDLQKKGGGGTEPISGTFNVNATTTKTITTSSRPKLVVMELGNTYKVIYDANKSTTQYTYASSGSASLGSANLGTGPYPNEFTFNISANGFTAYIASRFYYGDWHYTYVI